MQEPAVSVIVTTYNREELLKETIQSILNQTYTDFELIVVDNFSNYDFFKVIEEFGDARIKPFQNANNGIIAVNRNYGISKAKGRYIAFCDDDDLWKPEKLQIQIDTINSRRDVWLVCTNITRFYKTPEDISPNILKDHIITLSQLLRKNPIATSSVLLRNDSRVRFNESKTIVTVEDYELWLRLFMEGYGLYFIGAPLVDYRDCTQNTSNGKNKVLLPIRRIYVLSNIKIEYNLNSIRYILHVIMNLLELLAKLIVKK